MRTLVDHLLRALLPGDRGADVDRAGEPHRRRRAPRRGRNADRRDGRGVPQLVRRFFQPLQDLSDKFNTLQQAMAASERVFRLLDEDAAIGDRRPATAEPRAVTDGASR